ncbi:MAG: hypothetical protein M1812_005794 [Candelaria pacifica]|nr:MAG: hypothetical protein M1812_005794 [Candelaria pacifica]
MSSGRWASWRSSAMVFRMLLVEASAFPRRPSNRLASQHELARAYQADGQVKKAVELLEQVVAIREKVLLGIVNQELNSSSTMHDFA